MPFTEKFVKYLRRFADGQPHDEVHRSRPSRHSRAHCRGAAWCKTYSLIFSPLLTERRALITPCL